MASVNLDVEFKRDWPLANPWPWLGAGFALCVWSWLWTITFGPIASDGRIIVLVFGLLTTGVGVWLRHGDTRTVYVRAWMPPLAPVLRLLLGGFFALAALVLTGLFLSTFVTFRPEIGLRPGAALLVWLSAAPLFFFAAKSCFRREEGQELLDAREETGLAFGVLAGCCFLGSLTLLRDPADPTDWFSIRLFLRVFAAVSLYAAGLVLVATRQRRLILSLLFVLHFMAIGTACLAAPPSPWIVQQAWVRLFRPYLEFMYLNNAYHFYAPEPGPASYLWFRAIYAAPDGSEHGTWYKYPKLDARGNADHAVSLEYQRFLALTESVAPFDPLPSPVVTNPDGTWYNASFYNRRLNLQPRAAVVIGDPGENYVRIPLHPALPQQQQVSKPNESSRMLLGSFARFIARKFAVNPDDPTLKFKSVKIYRVIHHIPSIKWYSKPKLSASDRHLSPTDPELDRAYFMGNFDADGKLVPGDDDPYRYWLLPALRKNSNDPNSMIFDYARLHAGDPKWVREEGTERWVEHAAPSR